MAVQKKKTKINKYRVFSKMYRLYICFNIQANKSYLICILLIPKMY